MPRLIAIDLPGGEAFVAAVRRAWTAGDAVLPIDQRLPVAARLALLDSMAPAAIVDVDGERTVPNGRGVDDGDALVMPTSGSTGSPKGVVLTHAQLDASAAATSARLGVAPDDHWLACLPLAHIGGFSVLTKAWAAGTPLTVLPGFEAGAVTAAARQGCTLVSLVPTALARIDPALFRLILLGGSRPPADRPANCVTTYGLTESGGGVVYDGRPLDGVEVRIGSIGTSSTGSDVESEGEGEIFLRGPMLTRAYRDGTVPLDDHGWLATGDLGEWRSDGRLHVAGRRGDLIITGGENVWPETVEAALREAAGVADAAVAGVPDPEWGQRVVAWIVPADAADPPSLSRLRAAVAERLPTFMAPKEIVVIDVVPRTALGKVVRARLTSGRERSEG